MNAVPSSVLVVGTGLLGTSLGLALRRHGVRVHLEDVDADALAGAVAVGAGTGESAAGRVDLAVVAVPPAATGPVVTALLDEGRAAYVTDVASVKGLPYAYVCEHAAHPERYVGGHPMAGREVSGPYGALADLFEGRPWVLTPDGATDPRAVQLARSVVELAGASCVVLDPKEHDRAVALVSHAPHLMSVLMAGRLAQAGEHQVQLAGQGITDVTRVAGSDPALWQEILSANAVAVRQVLAAVRDDLDGVLGALDSAAHNGAAGDGLEQALTAGVAGRRRLPGKHGTAHEVFVPVQVVVADSPGQLARLFVDAGQSGANVEDVRIEHRLGQPTGMVEIDVRISQRVTLLDALRARGWTVHG